MRSLPLSKFLVLLSLVVGCNGVLAQNAITDWSAIAEKIVIANRPPASAEVLLGIVHAAMYDAVVAIEPGYEPFMSVGAATPNASPSAAAATAAFVVLKARVPAQEPALSAAYQAFLAALQDDTSTRAGIAVGEHTAATVLASRKDDGFDAAVAYVQRPAAPGIWEITGQPAVAVDVKLAKVSRWCWCRPASFVLPVRSLSGATATSRTSWRRSESAARLLSAYGGTNRDRPLLERKHGRSVEPDPAPARGGAQAEPSRVVAPACGVARSLDRCADRVLRFEVSRAELAPGARDPAFRAEWRCCGGQGLGAPDERESSRISFGTRLLDERDAGRHRDLLRNAADRLHDGERSHQDGATLRQRRGCFGRVH